MAAICLALLGFVLSEMIMPLMPERSSFGYFVPTNMALGALAGWVVMGPRAGGGFVMGLSNGLTGTFILLLWGLATQSTLTMLKLSMQRRYDGLGEAVLAVLSIGAEYFLTMATIPIAIVVLVGGAISGFVTNYAEQNWP
jgi:hypothetical protein